MNNKSEKYKALILDLDGTIKGNATTMNGDIKANIVEGSCKSHSGYVNVKKRKF